MNPSLVLYFRVSLPPEKQSKHNCTTNADTSLSAGCQTWMKFITRNLVMGFCRLSTYLWRRMSLENSVAKRSRSAFLKNSVARLSLVQWARLQRVEVTCYYRVRGYLLLPSCLRGYLLLPSCLRGYLLLPSCLRGYLLKPLLRLRSLHCCWKCLSGTSRYQRMATR